MVIDPKEISNIENSMVHDLDEEPKPEGWGIYVTLRFLSKVILGVYGLMLLGMVVLQAVIRRGQGMPVFLMPESVLVASPIALVAVYLYWTSDPEPDVIKQRTTLGRGVTLLVAFVLMQVISTLLWLVLAKAFSLH